MSVSSAITSLTVFSVLHPNPSAVQMLSEFQALNFDEGTWEQYDPRARTEWQSLANDGDAHYTGTVEIGGQKLKAVIDTGSFELVVLSAVCSTCGTPSKLYNASRSKSSEAGWLAKQHSYGSGITYSHNAHDTVSVGKITVKKQLFWSVYDADMDLLRADSFAVIFGVGPPTSAITFAEADNAQVRKELDSFKKQGEEITPKMLNITKQYSDVVNIAKNSTSFVENAGIKSMSACFGKESGSAGWHIWNDASPFKHPERFHTLKVIGDLYWSASMTEVGLGQGKLPEGANEALKHAAKPQKLGCHGEACSAMIDTGTSLIIAPSEIASAITRAVDDWVSAGGNCEDLSKLPDLHFKLNEEDFTLPPESYVGRASGILSAETRRTFPSLQLLESPAVCQALVLPMDVQSQFGPLWILGMPFFRKYYTSFTFKESERWHRYNPYSMAMSISDGTCNPTAHPRNEFAARSNNVEVQSGVPRRKAELNVDLAKIQIPPLVAKVASQFTAVKAGARTRSYIHI